MPSRDAEPLNLSSHKTRWAAIGAIALLVLTKLKTVASFVMPVFKFLKLGKILTTSGSMLVSVWFYSLAFGSAAPSRAPWSRWRAGGSTSRRSMNCFSASPTSGSC